ncbi:MAG: hypothetical protein GX811_12950, partial [Lentisphaerae bacterium]|nr:hypothetical protein [Lentisphaerota bacterium]
MKKRITFRSILIGTIVSALFAGVAIRAAHMNNIILSASQMPEAPFALVLLTVLLINPVCRLIRVIRPFNSVEMLIIFIMGLVSAGISSFGLAHPLSAHISGLFYRQWNNRQTEWVEYVVPFINESYFISEPGIREKAESYHEAFKTYSENHKLYNTSVRTQRAVQEETEARIHLETLEKEKDKSDLRLQIIVAKEDFGIASRVANRARNQWEKLQADDESIPDYQTVFDEYPAIIEANEKLLTQTRTELDEVQEVAMLKLDLFRKGLPKEQRAYPGALLLPQDDISTYRSRVQRLLKGMEALKSVKEARELAETQTDKKAKLTPESGQAIAALLNDASKELTKVSDSSAFETRRQMVWEKQELTDQNIFDLRNEIATLNEKRRESRDRSEIRKIESQIHSINNKIFRLQRKYKDIASEREVVAYELAIYERMGNILAELADLSENLQNPETEMTAGAVSQKLDGLSATFPSIDASLKRFFIGEIPWHHWYRPLINWGLLILMSYVLLMTFNILIFRQWAHNEKLTYPLMEIPKALVGGLNGEDDGKLPKIFKNPLFWIGVGIPVLVLGWNLICSMNLAPGLQTIDLQNKWTDYLSGTKLSAWRISKSEVFFTAIGLAFLIPKNISFSLWFFHVAYMLILFFMVLGGHGYDEYSFRANWWHIMNFRNAIGGGALVVFSLFVLWKCKNYILSFFNPSSVKNLELGEQKELRISSFLFLVSSVGLIVTLWLGMGANLGYTVFMYFFILIITIGLVRVVCEGGLPGFKTYISPFHFIRNLFGMTSGWTSATLFSPLVVYYAILFAVIKSFIAPAMANSLK